MLDKLIAAAGILWLPCVIVASIISGLIARSIYQGTWGNKPWESPKEGKTGGAVFAAGCIFPVIGLVLFLILMVVGFVFYGGLAVVKSLWNAA